MRKVWHACWGSARGPVRRLNPRTRLLAGAGLFAACALAPAASRAGVGLIALTVPAWLAVVRLPCRLVLSAAVLGGLLFLPLFLLVFWLPAQGLGLAGPWGMLVHGYAGLFMTLGTVGALSVMDLHDALVHLPLPGLVRAILIQIAHQAGVLIAETNRLTAAIAVRGASGGGRAAWRLAASLPRVWLPRVLQRAERLALAMELRGYTGPLSPARSAAGKAADALVLGLTLAWVGLAFALRWGIWP